MPAAPGSRLPVFRRVYADIGDEQSIAENLSTFSAHLAAVVEMTRDLARPALVLLDEVGAGTDPTEGGALGVAIVEHFRRAGATVVATTHHGLMKAYAQSTPGVEAASFGYDPTSYQPTYRLHIGKPGRSLALEMAERLGLPAELVADARARRDAKEEQAEALLARLETEKAAQERERKRLDAVAVEAEAALARATGLEREIQAKKRREVELFAKELKRRGDEAEQKAALAHPRRRTEGRGDAQGGGRRPAASQRRVAAIRDARDAVLKDPELGLPADQEAPSLPLAVGMRVRVRSMGVTGDRHGPARQRRRARDLRQAPEDRYARADRLRDGSDGEALPVTKPGCGARPGIHFPERSGRVWRVRRRTPQTESPGRAQPDRPHGRGRARARDKLLDDAALSDRRELRLVHGFGEGKLRKAVAELLEEHPLVASWRLGGPSEGGGGATVVELKD